MIRVDHLNDVPVEIAEEESFEWRFAHRFDELRTVFDESLL